MSDRELKFKKPLFVPPVEAPESSCEDDCCSGNEAAIESKASTTDPGDGIISEYRVHDMPVVARAKGRTYLIEGMDCSSCALTIENHLKQHHKVKSVSVNFSTAKMTIEHENSMEDIMKEVGKAGYKAIPEGRTRNEGTKSRVPSGQSTMVFAGVLLALGFLGSLANVAPLLVTLLYAGSILIGGYKPARSAYYAVKSRSLDMNVLMTAAAVGAALIGEWLEGATVVWLFSLGNALQTKSIEKTRNSIRNLMNLAPPEAWVRRNGELLQVRVEDVRVGEIITVKPGDKIPLDGDIVLGESSVNQAPITGESIPVDKQIGDAVYAGTINEHGSLEIKVTKHAEDTTIARIIHLVEEAQEQKAPTQAFVDRFARLYTPVVFAAALFVIVFPPLFGVGAWSEWFYRGLELLVVACPCALVISTPVAIVSAIGNAAKNGVLIKGGAFLETAGRISAIAFDKTGTLTEGKPQVAEVLTFSQTEQELLSIALTLEEHSNHPIARTIVAHAQAQGISAQSGRSFQNIVGKGVKGDIDGTVYYAGNVKLYDELHIPIPERERIEALGREGNSLVIVGAQDAIIGVIAVSDGLRASTVHALQELRYVGLKEVVMLTGDNEGTAKKIASQTAITSYVAELMPEEKADAVKRLQSEGHKVAMVGDGINDAPALATADLGIAMGGAGTDTAMETADVVLMADNLNKLPHTVKLSRKALQIIKQNIWFSLAVKLVALVLIFPGWLTLWIAVLSDTGAALLVILNSMRLLRFK
jgi:Zn2+/Cd2+-exporting ATPase